MTKEEAQLTQETVDVAFRNLKRIKELEAENAELHKALKQAVKIGTDWHYEFVELERLTRRLREQAKLLYNLANAPEGTIQ